MLAVDVEKQLGARNLACAEARGVTALFASPERHLVNMIAGWLTPDRGSIAIDGGAVDAARGIDVPPHRRRMATCSRRAGCSRISAPAKPTMVGA